jgi:hypothetical protein
MRRTRWLWAVLASASLLAVAHPSRAQVFIDGKVGSAGALVQIHILKPYVFAVPAAVVTVLKDTAGAFGAADSEDTDHPIGFEARKVERDLETHDLVGGVTLRGSWAVLQHAVVTHKEGNTW